MRARVSLDSVVLQCFSTFSMRTALSVVGSTVMGMEEELTLAQHRERFAAALESLRALEGVLWQAPSSSSASSLAGLLREVDDLGGACDAARVAVTAEAVESPAAPRRSPEAP